ncbi:hypothetical protein GCM10010394_67230 [Streptomyces crystallinus]|uniref:Uncharacterized protein n=1 Tax=Streptomyces crystallinus TaxID=68191 RepID=A0ABP3S9Z1_9ACTN
MSSMVPCRADGVTRFCVHPCAYAAPAGQRKESKANWNPGSPADVMRGDGSFGNGRSPHITTKGTIPWL